ncbi:MAG: DNA-deoxyinosine glycosylase [Christensenellales bacterium]|jgi:TDG/mug DNA glycosylase family protein
MTQPDGRIRSFGPIVGDKSRLLILGTAPSIASLQQGIQYGHPRNAFWPIVCELAGIDVKDGFDVRRKALPQRGLALWDVIESCLRPGSLDSAIREVVINDFDTLWKDYPSIKAVCCNGKTAQKLFLKHVELPDDVKYLGGLPSTSPAYTMPFEEKRRIWRDMLLPYIRQ